jgi:hypothetical protein
LQSDDAGKHDDNNWNNHENFSDHKIPLPAAHSAIPG